MPIHPTYRYYYRASWERLSAASRLIDEATALALYIAGLSGECMLRAWLDPDQPFDGGHHLPSILQRSTLLDGLGAAARQKVTVAVKSLTLLWTNSVRYYPEDRVASDLRRLPRFGKLKQGKKKGLKPLLRRAAEEAVEHVSLVVKAGEDR